MKTQADIVYLIQKRIERLKFILVEIDGSVKYSGQYHEQEQHYNDIIDELQSLLRVIGDDRPIETLLTINYIKG